MPFIEALIKEVVCIRPAFPTGIPHFTTEEIRYKNFVVPKDTIVILNMYSIFHDPDIFEEPEVFNPERFMQSTHGTRPGMDTDFRDNFSFRAGRRICPGQYAARVTMQLTTMRLIWAFSFSYAIDPKTKRPIGRELDFYDSAFIVMPYPFECKIQPRSSEQREIVMQAFNNAKSLLQHYE
ncbi:cytochrome P450 [Mycena haematopus]|nr:cytochrome P450 [Mycena haematopus]